MWRLWNKPDRDLDREISFHLETLADSYQRQGMSREEAMRAARREFGGVEPVKEACRDLRRWRPLAEITRDVRFGWRMMRRAPAITGAALLSLALGIGATTAILSLADVLLWRTLGVPEPRQLSEVFWTAKQRTGLSRRAVGSAHKDGALMVADFFSSQGLDALRASAEGKAGIAAHMRTFRVSASYDDQLNIVHVRPVAGNFFSVLRLHPAHGRLLNERDDTASAAPAVVLSHRFWTAKLGASPAVAGRPMRINNHTYEIAGVLPAEFQGIVPGEDVELYSSIKQSPPLLEPQSNFRESAADPYFWWLHLIARRAPGVTEAQLREVLDAGFAASWPNRPESAEATPRIRLGDASRGLGSIRRSLGNPILILLGLVGLVLVGACANIANLMLARATSREKEVALRISLGCGQGRLLRQFFTESLLLATLGGLLSIPVAAGILSMLPQFMPTQGAEMAISAAPDPRTLAGAAVVTLLSALLFGLYPSWRAVRIDAGPALKEVTGGSAARVRSRWMPARLLVLCQVSLGVVLVTAAVLFTGNLSEIVNRETGFDRGNTILCTVRPGDQGYSDDQLKEFYINLERRLNEVPGVQSAGMSITGPMSGGGGWSDLARLSSGERFETAVHHVSHRFLDAMRVPVTAGRMLTRHDVESGARVAVVSQEFAAQLRLPAPLGARFTMGFGEDVQYEIVGIARNAAYTDIRRAPPVVYVPFDYGMPTAHVVLNTSVPPTGIMPAVGSVVKDIDRGMALVDVYTMEQQISRTLQRERLFAWLCGGFGLLALILCVVGLYGLISHTTARRTQEIGIRMALGATRTRVVLQTLRNGLGLALGGLALGALPTVYVMRLAERQKLIPEGPFPLPEFAAAMGLIAISAALAVSLPALRAARIQPAQALRRG
ncbi:MAG: ABC transporter permease [Bryobacteraceae bacterium]|nr:ABC transporter permease [Bryobacteraceae bacterium]